MIRFILLQNRAGKTRLAKYYVPLEDGEKRHLEYDVHRLIAARDAKFTNFVEVCELQPVILPLSCAMKSAMRSALDNSMTSCCQPLYLDWSD